MRLLLLIAGGRNELLEGEMLVRGFSLWLCVCVCVYTRRFNAWHGNSTVIQGRFVSLLTMHPCRNKSVILKRMCFHGCQGSPCVDCCPWYWTGWASHLYSVANLVVRLLPVSLNDAFFKRKVMVRETNTIMHAQLSNLSVAALMELSCISLLSLWQHIFLLCVFMAPACDSDDYSARHSFASPVIFCSCSTARVCVCSG